MKSRFVPLFVILSWAGACLSGPAPGAAAMEKEVVPPISWHLTMSKGIAAAKAAERPALVVFTATGATSYNWFEKDGARKQVHAANMICIKIAPPAKLKLSSTAPPKLAEAFEAAQKKLHKDYAEITKKYGILRLPAVLFLSPDGETVLHSVCRRPESEVLKALKKIPELFDNYKRLQEALKAIQEQEKKEKEKKKAIEIPPARK